MGLMKLGLHKSWQLMLDHQMFYSSSHDFYSIYIFRTESHTEMSGFMALLNWAIPSSLLLPSILLHFPPSDTFKIHECWDWRSSQTTNWHEMGVFRWIRSHLLSYWSIVLKTVLWLADLTSLPRPPTVPADTDSVADVWSRDHCNSCHCSPKKL